MSLIEEAAKRLEQLRNAGVDLGERTAPAARGPGLADRGDRAKADRETRNREREPRERSLDASPAPRRPSRAEPEPPSQPHPTEHSRRISIDLARLAAAGMLTPDAPRSQIADEFRVIKRPLLASAQRRAGGPGAPANMIMVTS